MPRVEILIYFLAFQGLAQSTSAVISSTDEGRSTVARALAFIFFVAVVVGGLVWVVYFVHLKIDRERRAIYQLDKETGFCRWRDSPPSTDKMKKYTGFCDRYGAMFEDYRGGRDTSAAKFTFAALLTYRLLLGVFIGAMGTETGGDTTNGYLQTSMMILTSVAFLGFIVVVRPFAVCVANVFEGLVPVRLLQNTFSD